MAQPSTSSTVANPDILRAEILVLPIVILQIIRLVHVRLMVIALITHAEARQSISLTVVNPDIPRVVILVYPLVPIIIAVAELGNIVPEPLVRLILLNVQYIVIAITSLIAVRVNTIVMM